MIFFKALQAFPPFLPGHIGRGFSAGLAELSGRTLPVDTAVALRCARLHVSDKRGERDAFIAATALVHGMTVVTRNIADFETTGVAIVNPWIY
ncbi:PIN domain-containing protein [Salmonella enterica subsp. enterica serovar Infantis]|nr:type II toxin-antitoxin system VapC family toxin [Salmonella enterica subsp. enterica serovar Infantis]EJL7454976.1 PIN domain-containing protein [Salmonella enterica subsp. enterica serovar Infantis]EJS5768284.1 PIN domain-containing protein [Salmonella enterica subsp. enterica serovar Infantis]